MSRRVPGRLSRLVRSVREALGYPGKGLGGSSPKEISRISPPACFSFRAPGYPGPEAGRDR